MTEPAHSFETPRPPALGEEDRRELSRLAFESLDALMSQCRRAREREEDGPFPIEEPQIHDLPASGVLGERHGVFVTLRVDEQLRGCIGTARAHSSLAQGVVDYARAAASRDSRFPPVTPEEFPRLEVEISVLSRLAEVRSAPDEIPRLIQPGVHGLYMILGENRGLLLPQVASRLGLGAVEFLRSTAEKAGLEPDAWTHSEARLAVFTVESFLASRP